MYNKETHRVWKREWRKKNPEKVKAQRIKHASYMRNYYKIYYPANQKSISARQRAIRKKRLQFIIDFFGGKCIKCGFSDIRALQMDHKNGRKYGEQRIGNIDSRYKFVRDFPEETRIKYQLLCANCNWIKRDENNECRKPAKYIITSPDFGEST